MAEDRKPSSEESDTIRALRNKFPDLAAGEEVITPNLPPAEAQHTREAAMGIPTEHRGKVMLPKDPAEAASLPPVEDGFRNEPVFEEGMDREEYDTYRASIPPEPLATAPEGSPPATGPIKHGGTDPHPNRHQPMMPLPYENEPAMQPAAPETPSPAPETPSPAPETPSPAASFRPPPSPVSENPILTKLKQNLGVIGTETTEVEINGTVFTLRLATARLKSYAASAPAVMNAIGELHWGLYHMYGLASIYVVGVDHSPLYHVLGEAPTSEEFNTMERTSHMNPPYDLVTRTVPLFFDLLLDNLRDGLAVKIVEKYDEYFADHNTLKAYDDVDAQWKFECPQLNCEDTYSSTISGNFFCRLHGTQMISQEEARAAKIPLA